MYSPWTTSMPCLFSTASIYSQQNNLYSPSCNSNDYLTDSLHRLDLTNPFNIIATLSPTSSVWSVNSLNTNLNGNNHKENYFEPLPFLETTNQTAQVNHPQLSQKHTTIKQMIARKSKQQSRFNSCDNVSSAKFQRKKRSICSFCKSNGESADVYTSHTLRNDANEIECPVLMAYICPKCGATGKTAHTIKYCPTLSESERVALPTVKIFKEGRTASGNKNLFKK